MAAFWEKIHALDKQSRYAQEIELLRLRLLEMPNDKFSSWRLGDVLRKVGQVEEAERLLLALCGPSEPRRVWLTTALAETYRQKGELEQARRWFIKATELRPETTGPWIYLGGFYLTCGRNEQARAVLKRGLQAEGDVDEVHVNLGHCYRAEGDHGAAAYHYREALKMDPEDAETRECVEDCRAASGVAGAIRRKQKLLIEKGSGIATFKRRVARARRRGHHSYTIELLRLYLEAKPSDASAAQALGNALRIVGRYNEAEQILLALPDLLEPGYGLAAVSIGELYHQKGRLADAHAWFLKATELQPECTEPWLHLGEFYLLRGKSDLARSALENGLRARGDIDEVHVCLGNCYRAVAAYQTAICHYREAINIDPGAEDAWHGLADCEAALTVRENAPRGA